MGKSKKFNKVEEELIKKINIDGLTKEQAIKTLQHEDYWRTRMWLTIAKPLVFKEQDLGKYTKYDYYSESYGEGERVLTVYSWNKNAKECTAVVSKEFKRFLEHTSVILKYYVENKKELYVFDNINKLKKFINGKDSEYVNETNIDIRSEIENEYKKVLENPEMVKRIELFEI